MTIARVPLYFGPEERSRFGWVHAPEAEARDLAVVLCPPFGHESVAAHRSLRHLADALAEAGIAALRFDYDGTGDSAGSDEDPARVAAWLQSIRDAMEALRDRTGGARIGLAGLRLGATLASIAAGDGDVACVALWAPVRGRGYVRELKAIYLTSGHAVADPAKQIEPGGFVVTEETQGDLAKLEIAPTTARTAEFAAPPEMFLPPHRALVPEATIGEMVRWIADETRPQSSAVMPPATRRVRYAANGVSESIVQLPSGIFGILSEPLQGGSAPAILLPNAGATHHIGPNRLYVDVARALARAGFRSFRFDLPGLGDTFASPENDPYPENVTEILGRTMRELSDDAYIAMGLCSGAHAAFHAALELEDARLVESVVINPLTFYYKRGMSLDQPPANHYHEWQWYMHSIRQRERWLKLLRGEVQVGRVARAASTRVRLLLARKRDRLEADLFRIAERGRKLTFVFARFDPGYDLLMMNAGGAMKRLRRNGTVALWRIDDADHTFEAQRSRAMMIDSLVTHLRARYGSGTVPAAHAATRGAPAIRGSS